MKKLPRNVAAPEVLRKHSSKPEVIHRRVEITVEREIVSTVFCPASKHSDANGRCSHCGRSADGSDSQPQEEPT
jgi:hypothetical protein